MIDDLGRVGETVGLPCTARVSLSGMVLHVLNRGVGRMRLLLEDADFGAFERVMEKTLESRPIRICGKVVRYVERNAFRANLVPRVEDW